MARETKVGLLAGLAFIVCFAIILANRGREGWISRYVSPASQRVGQAVVQPHADGSAASRPSAVRRTEPTPADGTLADARHVPRSVPRSVPRRVDRQALPQHDTPDPGAADDAATTGAALPDGDRRDDDEWRRALEQRVEELTLALDAERRNGSQGSGLRTSDPVGGEDEDVPPFDLPAAATLSARTPPSGEVRYTVMPGDTLSKIAHTYYNSRSQTVVNAIFDANRGLMASPGEVRSGVELVLPVIEGYGSPNPARAERDGVQPVSPKRQPANDRGDEAPPFRWYQIQKNDRYVSIARRELGDESRWREIYELNKEKFPDPGKIRDGVRIKLPPERVASSQKGTP